MRAAALQSAIFSKLVNDSNVTNQLADNPGIYDHVPENAKAPYVAVGDTTANDWDTDTSRGVEAETSIHVWSEYRGRYEAKRIQDAIYKALHRQPLTVTDADVIDVYQTFADTELDPDGHTRHGVQRFTITLEDQS